MTTAIYIIIFTLGVLITMALYEQGKINTLLRDADIAQNELNDRQLQVTQTLVAQHRNHEAYLNRLLTRLTIFEISFTDRMDKINTSTLENTARMKAEIESLETRIDNLERSGRK